MLSALADLFLPMKRESFLRLLAERFYPVLRKEGFQGSGTTLRRIRGPVVHVVNIQGSSSASGFYVNLGAHLMFLPTEGGAVPVADSLEEEECAFRDRIVPSSREGRWPYRRTWVKPLLRQWQVQGRAFFARYSSFPDDFNTLVEAFVREKPPEPYAGLKHAQIALQLGRRDDAITLARDSLAEVPPVATVLRARLERFLNELGAAGPRG